MAQPEKTQPAKTSPPPIIAGVKLTHPDRVLFDEQGVTKADLARYYEAVSDKMLAHAGNRLLSLVRCPEGAQKACFFQKHYAPGMGDRVLRTPVKQSDGVRDYLYVRDAAGLVGCVQMGVLEFHIWGSQAQSFEQPDRLVFDLDPDEGLDFAQVRDAAADVRTRLKRDGLTSFAMVTGGKGVHVIAPLSGKLDWPRVKDYAQAFAQQMEAEAPQRFVATMAKAKRKGRIFIDWLRNERGATAIAPFSTRARAGAPIAMPVSWPELAKLERASGFTLADGRKRGLGVWRGYDALKQSLA